ncbi:hypothetical protein JX265_012899 [Neoarthrinium moseri]|uniref:Heterokaryon incompatibility domain-containing protein n=1 Tax=Neoarthrinium moseri TaxID=1658444 RepID=A0A9P9W990_9PEZI|nr:hypothetical protein JX265_012899 [Neoarthrinium moseri]
MGSVYEPLPETSHIRLLQVQVDQSSGDLVCDFKIVRLDDAKPDPFTAISYTWGQPAPPASSIRLSDGRVLPLSQTLTDLFDALRRRRWHFAVWIDSLCINQHDAKEKASQVSMMGQIYSSAQELLVWLGASTPEARRAFHFMGSSRPSTAEDAPAPDESLAAGLKLVLSILARPWFRRVWVIQEVTLNSGVSMVCGDDLVGFATFQDYVFSIWKFLDDWHDYDDDDPRIQGLWSATRLINLRREFLRQGFVRYEILLQAAFYCEATDQRDAVFAFRGIGEQDRPVPPPDYTVPIGQEPHYSEAVQEVYRKTAVALLCHGPSLDLLALGGIERPRSPGLPTWAPDLRYLAFIEPFVPCDIAEWNAGGPLGISPELISPGRLKIQVCPIGTIDEACPVFDAYSVADQKEAMERIFRMKSTLPGSTQQDCLGQLAMDLLFGLDIDDLPAGPVYHEYFTEWLQWLRASSSQDDLAKISHNKYHRTISMRVDGWKAFTTLRGDFCIGPACAEVGDMVCTVPGCRLPMIIRSAPGESGVSGTFEQSIIVSWCYVRGLMDHKAAKSQRMMMAVTLQ